ncbi:hypothetical protein [Poseidonocella sp. HB161398]|uniref:hypothetical protein n=1 Tax=Poseidonocella sp. HB161398 TaxID=2320855 RepID=UPI0011087600|nr:hypothetical protein [Poseidonocella sp. HB161398]
MSHPFADTPGPGVYMLEVVRRQTGRRFRTRSGVLRVLARDPAMAADELMRNRDPELWQVRVAELPRF